jgi:thymidine phosphorylase
VESLVLSQGSGYVTAIDAHALGNLLVAMGGGRGRKEDTIDPAVGIRLLRKTGDRVEAGEPLALIEAHRAAPDWADAASRAYSINDEPSEPRPLIIEQVVE